MNKKLKEDLEFSKRIKESWKEIDESKFTKYSKEDLLILLDFYPKDER